MAVWYGFGGYLGIKLRLTNLVGWERPVADGLNSMEAFNVCYDFIYDELPECRGCLCTFIE